MGAPDSPVRHRTGTMHCQVCLHVTQPLGFGAKSTVGALSPCGIGQSGATSNSLVPSDFCAALLLTVAPVKVDRCASYPLLRWHTGQSGEL